MNIVILDAHALNPGDLSWEDLSRWGRVTVYPRTPAAEVAARAVGAEIVVTNKVVFSDDLLQRLPELRMIAVTATGYNIIDVAAAARRGVTVCNVPAYSTDSVAQLVFAFILELAVHVGAHDHAVHEGAWSAAPDFTFARTPLIELAGKTLGLVGFGQIGRRVGEIGHAFGMKVVAHSRSRHAGTADGTATFLDLADLLPAADFVSLHVPLTAETERMVNRQTLRMMKHTAFLINTARGALVDEADLAAALREARLAGAALDVLSAEPPLADNPLLAAPHCLITPHYAWATREARQRCVQVTLDNVAAFVAGKPIHVVNPKG